MSSLEQAIGALPTTADEVAAYLAERGIRGVRENGECCPIANYLTGQGLTGVFVDPEYAFADGASPVRTGGPICEFALGFDQGRWPKLDAPAEQAAADA